MVHSQLSTKKIMGSEVHQHDMIYVLCNVHTSHSAPKHKMVFLNDFSEAVLELDTLVSMPCTLAHTNIIKTEHYNTPSLMVKQIMM